MKQAIFILFLFAGTAQAQTLTTAKLSDSVRKINKRIELLLLENKNLKEWRDSAEIMTVNPQQFEIDENKVLSIKPGAFVVMPKGTLGSNPVMGLSTPAITYDAYPRFSTPSVSADKKDIEVLKQDVEFLASIIKGLLETIDKQNRKLELLF